MNWIPISLNWTILFKCLEMTIVVIWRYINKTELNWIINREGSYSHVSLNPLTNAHVVRVIITYKLSTCLKGQVLVTGSKVWMVVKLPGEERQWCWEGDTWDHFLCSKMFFPVPRMWTHLLLWLYKDRIARKSGSGTPLKMWSIVPRPRQKPHYSSETEVQQSARASSPTAWSKL